ncbi:unnamed protein product [Ambrosiozyma monospora]|uniref:Unnamed protein product n=1 Tax=Ambrosiozyma monospora TaxID=43982 RepID=A0ACB5T825_AMBMO|nr:unnamed protein product [Ambrosiozyma monospora]
MDISILETEAAEQLSNTTLRKLTLSCSKIHLGHLPSLRKVHLSLSDFKEMDMDSIPYTVEHFTLDASNWRSSKPFKLPSRVRTFCSLCPLHKLQLVQVISIEMLTLLDEVSLETGIDDNPLNRYGLWTNTENPHYILQLFIEMLPTTVRLLVLTDSFDWDPCVISKPRRRKGQNSISNLSFVRFYQLEKLTIESEEDTASSFNRSTIVGFDGQLHSKFTFNSLSGTFSPFLRSLEINISETSMTFRQFWKQYIAQMENLEQIRIWTRWDVGIATITDITFPKKLYSFTLGIVLPKRGSNTGHISIGEISPQLITFVIFVKESQSAKHGGSDTCLISVDESKGTTIVIA